MEGKWKDASESIDKVLERALAIRQELNPEDRIISLNDVDVRVTGGLVRLRCRGHDADWRVMTPEAFGSLVHDLFPGGRGMFRQLLQEGPPGEKQATDLFRYAIAHRSLPYRKLRIGNLRTPSGGTESAIRGLVSKRYLPIDHVELLKDMRKLSELHDYRVVDYHVSSSHMVLRMACDSGKRLMSKSLELRNSEVGSGSVRLLAGVMRLVCSNGMIGEVRKDVTRIRHVERRRRVSLDWRRFLEHTEDRATGLAAAYKRALVRPIEDVDETLAALREDDALNHTELKAAIRALDHSTTTKESTLARLVDALTLGAQYCQGPSSWRMEGLAVDLLLAKRKLSN